MENNMDIRKGTVTDITHKGKRTVVEVKDIFLEAYLFDYKTVVKYQPKGSDIVYTMYANDFIRAMYN